MVDYLYEPVKAIDLRIDSDSFSSERASLLSDDFDTISFESTDPLNLGAE